MATIFKPSKLTHSDLRAFARMHPRQDKAMQQRLVANTVNGLLVEQREQREIFFFNAPDLGEVLFDVRGIKDALAAHRLTAYMLDVTMDIDWIEHLRAHGGVEAEHIARLTAADLERPGVAVFWPNRHTTLIDGNNRAVRRYDDGLRSFRLARVNVDFALEPFIWRPVDEEKFCTLIQHDPDEKVLHLRTEIKRI